MARGLVQDHAGRFAVPLNLTSTPSIGRPSVRAMPVIEIFWDAADERCRFVVHIRSRPHAPSLVTLAHPPYRKANMHFADSGAPRHIARQTLCTEAHTSRSRSQFQTSALPSGSANPSLLVRQLHNRLIEAHSRARPGYQASDFLYQRLRRRDDQRVGCPLDRPRAEPSQHDLFHRICSLLEPVRACRFDCCSYHGALDRNYGSVSSGSSASRL